MPGPWHLIHLEAAGEPALLRLIGAGMAGLPGVMVGHNERIAWGATAAFPDTADLCVEKRHPQDPTPFPLRRCLGAGPNLGRDDRRGVESAPRRQTVTVTRHGPLITDFLADSRAKFFRPWPCAGWAIQKRCSVEALLALQRFRNWEEFRQAAGRHITPALTLVYADRTGNIGLIVAGRVPIRAAGRGFEVPAPGRTGTPRMEQGWHPARSHASAFQPA